MRKLLIVDDEKFIRKGLRSIIEGLDSGFKQVFEARNGKEALDLIIKEKIELVVTDISMPGMDGLTCMGEAQTLSFKPKFIILSGYDDFHYAKEAIKHGAKDYLLKPVKADELYAAIKKVEQELNKEELTLQKNEKANALINKFREDELKIIFLDENVTEYDIKSIVSTINLDIFGGSFYVTVLERRPSKGVVDTNTGFDKWNSDLQLNVLTDRYFTEYSDCRLNYITIKGNLVFITKTEINFNSFIDYLEDKTGDCFAAGMSEECKETLDIRKAYLQACEALKYRILFGGHGVVHYSGIICLNTIYSIPSDTIKKIPQIVGTSRINDLRNLLYEIFDRNVLMANNISYLENIIECINTNVIGYFAQNMPQKANNLEEQNELLKNVFNFNTIDDYFNTFRDYLMEINQFILVLKETYNENNVIDRAVAFIRENYDKDLNMTVVSNHVSLNYTYFSYLFMEHLGMSFVDFLKKVRIEKALELLSSSNYRINEIAEKVGFKDPKYFTKIFRSINGISPAEYRDKYLLK